MRQHSSQWHSRRRHGTRPKAVGASACGLRSHVDAMTEATFQFRNCHALPEPKVATPSSMFYVGEDALHEITERTKADHGWAALRIGPELAVPPSRGQTNERARFGIEFELVTSKRIAPTARRQ